MRDPKNEKLRNFRHGDRKWRRRYDDGTAPRDLRRIEPDRIKIFPARKRLTVEERKAERERREKLLTEKMARWSREFFMHMKRPVVTAEQATKDLRDHSRMY